MILRLNVQTVMLIAAWDGRMEKRGVAVLADPRMTHQTPPPHGQGIVRRTLGLFKDRLPISVFPGQ
jgi:hypothetical protein